MRSHPPPAGIIFDLDGTLVDTVSARIGAWEAVFGEFEIPIARARLGPMIGMDGRQLAIDAARAARVPIDAATAEAIDHRAGVLFDERNRAPQPLPWARELLRELNDRRVTWAIATSSRREQVTASVAALELDIVPKIVDGTHVAHAKPAPDLLLLAARELDLTPRSCWYVGDSTWDMLASVAADMRGIGVLAGAAVDDGALRAAGASVVLGTLRDLELDG